MSHYRFVLFILMAFIIACKPEITLSQGEIWSWDYERKSELFTIRDFG